MTSGVVALLFTDLVGSTELLARLGDDAAEELRRTHFGLLRQAMAEAGGEEVKTLGDGVMASFASPVEAVGCGVAIQRAVEEHNRARPERAIQVRVGLHAGEPVHEEGDFFGTAVVVAKRLCDQAQGGQILASELLVSLVGSRGGFHFRPLGPLALKGLPERVRAVAVECPPAAAGDALAASSTGRAPAAPRTLRRPRGPALVGRDKELALLEDELAAAAQGEFRCVLVSGEAGVGKTRLAAELLGRAGEGVTTLTARAHPMGGADAFGLWAEVLDSHFRGLDPREVSDLCGGFLDDLASISRTVAAVRGGVPERPPSRLGLLEGLTVVLANLVATGPAVVLLDEVHQADASSWDALHYAADNLSQAPLLVVATARPEELAGHVVASQVLFSLDQDGLLTRVSLSPLDPPAIGRLAEAVLHQAPPPALVDWLVERSRGNALFALGLLRALREEGADLSAPRLRRLPESLSERVRSRLADLDEPALVAIEALAVLGRASSIPELAGVVDRPPEQVSAILEGLLATRLVVEEAAGPEVAYVIPHPLVQEAIYEAIRTSRRRALHRQIGRALLTGGRVGEAVPHFARSAGAGDSEAIDALRQAFRQAEERRAYREGLAVLAALVDLLPEGDERWLEIAEVLSPEAEWAEEPNPSRADAELAIGAYRAIDAALDRTDDPVRQGVVKLRLANLLAWGIGDTNGAERACVEAEQLFEEAGDAARALLARHEAGWAQGLAGDMAAFYERARLVADAAEATGQGLVALLALTARGGAAFNLGRFAEGERAIREALARASMGRRPPTNVRTTLAMSLALEGRAAEARALLEEARSADPRYRNTALSAYSIIVAWLAGDLDSALRYAEEAVAWNVGGFSVLMAAGLPFAALAAVEANRPEEAGRFLELAHAAYGEGDWWLWTHCMRVARGILDAEAGHADDALPALSRAGDRLLAESPPLASFVLLDLAEVAAGAGEAARAAEAAGRLHELAAGMDRDLYRGLAATASAWASLASGAFEEAAGSARHAVELLEPLGCRLFFGRALDVLGRALSATDPAGAHKALERAVEVFEACGAVRRRDRALDALGAMK